MKIEYPDGFDLNDLNETYLWRYIDQYKLISLFETNSIYFARFDNFKDKLEGITGKNISLKAITRSRPLTKETVNKNISEEDQNRLIRQDQLWRKELASTIENSQKTQFASCWYIGKNESLEKWTEYLEEPELGVTVKFHAKQLTESIIVAAETYTNTDFHFLYFGKIAYKNIEPFDPHERYEGKFNGLKKDKNYTKENEVRFVAVTPISKKGVYDKLLLPLGSLKSYDFEIIASPIMVADEYEKIKKLLVTYGLDSKLRWSEHKK